MANAKRNKKTKVVENAAVKAWKTRRANLVAAEKAAKHAKRGAKKTKTAQEVVAKILAPKPETEKQVAQRKAKALLANINETVTPKVAA